MFRSFRAVLPPLTITGIGALVFSASYIGLVVAAFGVADSVGRYRDFRYLSRFEYLPVRLVDFYGKSFCGRNVILTIDPDWLPHYRRRGYLWYHLLPDGFPSVLKRKAFWVNLFTGHTRTESLRKRRMS